jgi:hypothetical protein
MTPTERALLLLLSKAVRNNLDTPGSISRDLRDLSEQIKAETKEE